MLAPRKGDTLFKDLAFDHPGGANKKAWHQFLDCQAFHEFFHFPTLTERRSTPKCQGKQFKLEFFFNRESRKRNQGQLTKIWNSCQDHI